MRVEQRRATASRIPRGGGGRARAGQGEDLADVWQREELVVGDRLQIASGRPAAGKGPQGRPSQALSTGTASEQRNELREESLTVGV
jgi:hypothetical protein